MPYSERGLPGFLFLTFGLTVNWFILLTTLIMSSFVAVLTLSDKKAVMNVASIQAEYKYVWNNVLEQ